MNAAILLIASVLPGAGDYGPNLQECQPVRNVIRVTGHVIDRTVHGAGRLIGGTARAVRNAGCRVLNCNRCARRTRCNSGTRLVWVKETRRGLFGCCRTVLRLRRVSVSHGTAGAAVPAVGGVNAPTPQNE